MKWVYCVASFLLGTSWTYAAEKADPAILVEREVYVAQTTPGQTRWTHAYYVGSGLEREEVHSFMAKSDTPEQPQRRRSLDNGKTWSEFEPLPDVVSYVDGARVFWGPMPLFFDQSTERFVSIWLRQTKPASKKRLYYNHCFSRISTDGGKSWAAPRQLRYEPGPDFDAANPLNPKFLEKNQAYFGSNIIRHSNGSLIHVGAAVNVPYENKTGKSYDRRVPASAKNIGSVCFMGRWDADLEDYRWESGAPVWIPLEQSARGLMESDVTELEDGRLLVVWRGSDTPITKGRKWFSVSEDGGKTLSPVAEWKYADGTRFYSPSSLHRFLRHSVTKKLYWIGNISERAPSGNSPRYPLIIAEVDESIPALKRETLTAIDSKGPDDHASLQLSNFYLLEDRETKRVELYMTRLVPHKGAWDGHAYRYFLSFR